MTLIQTLCGSAAMLAACQAGAADLTVHVDDVKSGGGALVVAVYNSAGSFLRTALSSASSPASGATGSVVIKDLPAGEIAFSVYHDANANGKMDRNLLGIPTERYAFSNNAFGKMGPPSFEQARFTLPAGGASVRVSLR